jgi:hypothetical protein
MWLRHREQQRMWCAVARVSDHHAGTHCRGSITVTDALQFDVCDDPPAADRCGACVRAVEAEELLAGLQARPAAQPFVMFDFSDVDCGGLE